VASTATVSTAASTAGNTARVFTAHPFDLGDVVNSLVAKAIHPAEFT